MADEPRIFDFAERLRAKLEDERALRYRVEQMIDAESLLADAINEMRETLADEDVVRLLRRAIEILEE